LSWFLLEDDAKTTPILRFAQDQALRVKPMLDGRAYARKKIHHEAIIECYADALGVNVE